MARALPNAEHQIADLRRGSLRGVGRDTTRHHLLRQLRELDAQIETITHAQNQDWWQALERAMWLQPSAAKVVWTGRLQLHYLHTVRQALVETLTRL